MDHEAPLSNPEPTEPMLPPSREMKHESPNTQFVREDLSTYRKVNVIAKPPRRVQFYKGKGNTAVSTPALNALERKVRGYLTDNPEASEEETVVAIQEQSGRSSKRVPSFHSSTIRRIIQEVRG
jgi:hypothetical protein